MFAQLRTGKAADGQRQDVGAEIRWDLSYTHIGCEQEDRGVGVNDQNLAVAVDSQPGHALAVAVEQAIRRQIGPPRECCAPLARLSDRTRPGD